MLPPKAASAVSMMRRFVSGSTLDLSGKAARQNTYVVRDQYTPLQSGAIVIRVLSLPRGGSVQLDALVARR